MHFITPFSRKLSEASESVENRTARLTKDLVKACSNFVELNNDDTVDDLMFKFCSAIEDLDIKQLSVPLQRLTQAAKEYLDDGSIALLADAFDVDNTDPYSDPQALFEAIAISRRFIMWSLDLSKGKLSDMLMGRMGGYPSWGEDVVFRRVKSVMHCTNAVRFAERLGSESAARIDSYHYSGEVPAILEAYHDLFSNKLYDNMEYRNSPKDVARAFAKLNTGISEYQSGTLSIEEMHKILTESSDLCRIGWCPPKEIDRKHSKTGIRYGSLMRTADGISQFIGRFGSILEFNLDA